MNMFYSIYFASLIILLRTFVASWDVVVVTEKEIEFYNREKLVGSIRNSLKGIISIAYDPVGGNIFISEGDDSKLMSNIFSINFEPTSNVGEVGNIRFQLLVGKFSGVIQGIAYDVVSQTLFWTAPRSHAIYKLALNEINTTENPKNGTVVHQFITEIPSAIAIDACRRYIYWTNCNHLNATIERSLINGSEREVIVSENLFQPSGIFVDEETKSIYWTNDREGIYYGIEKSDLDGKNRIKLREGTYMEPYSITATSDFIYFTDWISKAFLALPKISPKGQAAVERIVKKYVDTKPIGVTSASFYDNIHNDECVAVLPSKEQIKKSQDEWESKLETANYFSSAEIMTNQNTCLNNGSMLPNGLCSCSIYYDGQRCEYSKCHNYCLYGGHCVIGQNSKPECMCPPKRGGNRCEFDLCSKYCLNNGLCVSNNYNEAKVSCKCTEGYEGDRCEIDKELRAKVCDVLCQISNETIQNSINSSLHNYCECNEKVLTDLYDDNYSTLHGHEHEVLNLNKLDEMVSLSLSIVCVILLVIVILLSFRICKYQKGPKIRKRIILKKPVSPDICQSQSPSDHCEITIENCCNMNICETPCFEPDSRTPKATFFNKKQSEDKTSLIGISQYDSY